jgi:hypothetical protein
MGSHVGRTMGLKKFLKKAGSFLGPVVGSLFGPVGMAAGSALSLLSGGSSKDSGGGGLLSGLGSLLSLGGNLGIARSQRRSQKEIRRSLMEERTLANREREREQGEMEGKKKQLTDLRRTVRGGKRSLLSAWYDDDLLGKQTIGA